MLYCAEEVHYYFFVVRIRAIFSLFWTSGLLNAQITQNMRAGVSVHLPVLNMCMCWCSLYRVSLRILSRPWIMSRLIDNICVFPRQCLFQSEKGHLKYTSKTTRKLPWSTMTSNLPELFYQTFYHVLLGLGLFDVYLGFSSIQWILFLLFFLDYHFYIL